MVVTDVAAPQFLGFNSNGDLYVAGHAPADLVITSVTAPNGCIPPPVPCSLY